MAAGPRTSTSRWPARRARRRAASRRASPQESRNVNSRRSSTTHGGRDSSTRRSSSSKVYAWARSSSPRSAIRTAPEPSSSIIRPKPLMLLLSLDDVLKVTSPRAAVLNHDRGRFRCVPKRYVHTCVRVLDPDRSVAFYEALGYERRGKLQFETAYNLYLGLPGDGDTLELTVNVGREEPYDLGDG